MRQAWEQMQNLNKFFNTIEGRLIYELMIKVGHRQEELRVLRERLISIAERQMDRPFVLKEKPNANP